MATFLEDFEKFNQILHCYKTKGSVYSENSENIQEINFIVIEGICKIYHSVFWEALFQAVAQNTHFKNVSVDNGWRSCLQRKEICCTLYCLKHSVLRVLKCSEAQTFCLIERSITSQIFQSSHKIRYDRGVFYQLFALVTIAIDSLS